MDAGLSQTAFSQRDAAAQAVASSLVPRGATSTAKSAASAATTSTSSSTAAANPSDITTSDFLQLLVSELQNQDPTQPTDPNEYITQLAQVNSLEQLIQINSGISTLDSSVPTSSSSTTPSSISSSSTPDNSTPGSATSGNSSIGVSPADRQPASAPATTSEIHWQHPGVAGF